MCGGLADGQAVPRPHILTVPSRQAKNVSSKQVKCHYLTAQSVPTPRSSGLFKLTITSLDKYCNGVKSSFLVKFL